MARGRISHIALTVSDLLAGRSVELQLPDGPVCARRWPLRQTRSFPSVIGEKCTVSEAKNVHLVSRRSAFGAFVAAKEVAPAMIARGRGTMLFTGATAGVKAGPKSVSFGPAKFAMRGLAQSLARDLGPRGIHVARINVDGSIDIPGTRGLKPSLQDGDFLKPDAIAEPYWHLAHQDPSAWTMELEVRPFKEKF